MYRVDKKIKKWYTYTSNYVIRKYWGHKDD